MKKKIAILRASGFIGSYLTRFLLANEIMVTACSRQGGMIDDLTIEKIDLTKGVTLSGWIQAEEVTDVIYLSWKIPASFALADWALCEANLKMHKSVLDAWKEHKFHLSYASRCSVYIPHCPAPWTEDQCPLPDNYYTLSKLYGELLFDKEHSNLGLPLTIMRINAPYAFDHPVKTVINIFIERALGNENLELFASGRRQQAYVYIQDICRAFLCGIMGRKSGIFNVASGETTTMKHLAETVIRLTDSGSKVVFSPKPDPFENQKIRIDMTKSREILGFIPAYNLETGLQDCIRNYRNTTA